MVTIALALVLSAKLLALKQMESVMNRSWFFSGFSSFDSSVNLWLPVSSRILTIAFITWFGNFPTEVSPLSITASAPSNTALATSFTSALVGVEDSIMLSIIWVAITTGFEYLMHLFTIIF